MIRRKRGRRRGTLRRPVAMKPSPGHTSLIKFILVIALAGVGVVLMILFGFPLIEDLVNGVDPSLRYKKQVEADFVEAPEDVGEVLLAPQEVFLSEYKIKNEPYIDGEKMVFTTQHERSGSFQLDAVVLYDLVTGEDEVLDIEKKYTSLMNPVMSGGTIILVDSNVLGGGRIIGYDTYTGEQFLVKEYAYAIPRLSLEGDYLVFMQWAGESTQRLYMYNIRTHEPVTIKLFETEIGNSSADVSEDDIVWAEYDENGNGVLKRLSLSEEGASKYENYDFGNKVFEPRTNGKDIIFATEKDIISGSLMLSTNGGQPVKIADNVINYELGDGFFAYTKDNKVHVQYTNAQDSITLTSDIANNVLASVNGNALCYYDITDIELLDEVVLYAFAS